MDTNKKYIKKKYKLSNKNKKGGSYTEDVNDKIYITFEKKKLKNLSKNILSVDCVLDYNKNILRKSNMLMKANNLYLLLF